MIHGNKEWLASGQIYKYTTMIALIEIIMAVVVGLPVAMALFH